MLARGHVSNHGEAPVNLHDVRSEQAGVHLQAFRARRQSESKQAHGATVARHEGEIRVVDDLYDFERGDALRYSVGVGEQERRRADTYYILFIDYVEHLNSYRRRRSIRKADFCAVQRILVSHGYAVYEGGVVHYAVKAELSVVVRRRFHVVVAVGALHVQDDC